MDRQLSYHEIKKMALVDVPEYNKVYEYETAYVFSIHTDEDMDGGYGSPWAYFKDGSGSVPYYAYIDGLDFDPDEINEDESLGTLLDFETGEPVDMK